jgi:phosphoribosyl-ATP pyrophosphohydrolase/phosphoribosyl-AMP cyclohydrolase/histidinol dehydrogenase
METTLPLPFLPSVEIGNDPSEPGEGLTRTQLSYLGCVYIVATTHQVDALLQFLQENVSTEAYINVTAIESIEDIVLILDAGARKVFVNSTQLYSLASFGDRVLPVYEASRSGISANGTLFEAGDDPSVSKATLQRLVDSKASPIFFIMSNSPHLEELIQLAQKFSAIPIIPATKLMVEKGSAGQGSISAIIGGSWTSDRADKLIPTVVTDERGIALGLVYSSQESLAESLRTGTGVYQSRKRGLWYKGATSGDTQELVRVSMDCDQDCLKFVVRQKGRGM